MPHIQALVERPGPPFLRKNEDQMKREGHSWQDKLAKLEAKLGTRNKRVDGQPGCRSEAGQRQLEAWLYRDKLHGLASLKLVGRRLVLEKHPEVIKITLEFACCDVVAAVVARPDMSIQQVHDCYLGLQKLEQDFRKMTTDLLEVRPVFVHKMDRTRGHVFPCMPALKLTREIERRLRAACGTTETDPQTLTLPDALAALSRRCPLEYKIDDKATATKLPLPNANQQQILTALGVTLRAQLTPIAQENSYHQWIT